MYHFYITVFSTTTQCIKNTKYAYNKHVIYRCNIMRIHYDTCTNACTFKMHTINFILSQTVVIARYCLATKWPLLCHEVRMKHTYNTSLAYSINYYHCYCTLTIPVCKVHQRNINLLFLSHLYRVRSLH